MNWIQNWQLLVRRTKRAIEWAAYGLFDYWVLHGKTRVPKPDRTAIVHLELLGDAVLWLPYGQCLVNHLRANGREVVLVVDKTLVPLFARAFPGVLIEPFDRRGVVKSFRIRRQNLLTLRLLGAVETLQTSSPRDALVVDAAVHALGSPAWGFTNVCLDRPWFDRQLNDGRYAHLIPEQTHVHRSRRYNAFLRALGVDGTNVRPAEFGNLPPSPLSGVYWVLAPGASRRYKQWPIEHFSSVMQRLAHWRPDWQCVVVGTAQETNLAQAVVRNARTKVVDLTGQTDLPTLIALIAHARLVLCNDSAAGHIAAATGTPSIVVAGGGEWGRCYPYDPEHTPVRMLPHVVACPMPCFGCRWLCRYTTRSDQPFPCIVGVNVDDVWEAVERVLALTEAG